MRVNPGLQSFFGFLVWMSRLRRGRPLGDEGSVDLRGYTGAVNFEIGGEGGGSWHCLLEAGSVRFFPGAHPEPRGTVKLALEDFFRLLARRASYATLGMTGRIRVSGDGHVGMVLWGILAQAQQAARRRGILGALARLWLRRVLARSRTGYTLEGGGGG